MGNFLPNLQQLYLGANPLSGIIPSFISNASLLIELEFLKLLASNNLTVESYTPESSFFSTLSNFRYLEMLLLSDNPQNGIFPNSVRNLSTSLKYFGIGHCSINGNIPREIGSLSSLMTLLLDNNQFVGPIATTPRKLDKLEALYLQNNMLNPRFQSSGRHNKLEGFIPPDLCNLESLVELNLASNEFIGGILECMGNLKSLRNLYLAFNQLTSMVPLSLWNLTYILEVNLSSNLLDGSLSIKMGNMKVLRILYLSRNHLEFLNLSNNKLSGEIPKSLEAFIYLKYLNVSFNRLQGKIPTEGPLENFLATSFMLNKALCGASRLQVLPCKEDSPLKKKTIVVHVLQYVLPAIGGKSFDIECEVLWNTCHRNLIKIINICSNIEFKALVLEYMPNGNSEKWLYSHNQYLNILQRLNIMLDVASTLEYLHYGYSATIVNCDFKPSNILLDEDLVAHVANFGMEKLLGDGDSMIRTMTLATIEYGTSFFNYYQNLNYGSEGIISTRGNMYSHGILLMETFTRKRRTNDIFSEEMNLKSWIEELLQVLSVTDIIDDNLLSNESDDASMEELISSIMRLALDCYAESPEQRINIKNVSDTLHKIKLKFLQHHTDQGN
ncbi:hypothetical protein I3760_09G132500 [Carya illinoinensis]|nr:hypothetical protein I3760_09G132500 [Carya illinoinensis]